MKVLIIGSSKPARELFAHLQQTVGSPISAQVIGVLGDNGNCIFDSTGFPCGRSLRSLLKRGTKDETPHSSRTRRLVDMALEAHGNVVVFDLTAAGILAITGEPSSWQPPAGVTIVSETTAHMAMSRLSSLWHGGRC